MINSHSAHNQFEVTSTVQAVPPIPKTNDGFRTSLIGNSRPSGNFENVLVGTYVNGTKALKADLVCPQPDV